MRLHWFCLTIDTAWRLGNGGFEATSEGLDACPENDFYPAYQNSLDNVTLYKGLSAPSQLGIHFTKGA